MIREEIEKTLDHSGKYKMGWIPEHKKEVVDAILALLTHLIQTKAEEIKKQQELDCPSYKAFGALGHNISACDCLQIHIGVDDLSSSLIKEMEGK